MGISQDYIMSELNKYANTNKGKKQVRKFINDKTKNSTSKQRPVVSDIKKDIDKVVSEVLKDLLRCAYYKEIPDSVYETLTHARASTPFYFVTESGNDTNQFALVDITIPADYGRRESLSKMAKDGSMMDEKTGEGIDNIVALFNKGYVARKSLKGFWHVHDCDILINSRAQFEGLHFVEDVIEHAKEGMFDTDNISVSIHAGSDWV